MKKLLITTTILSSILITPVMAKEKLYAINSGSLTGSHSVMTAAWANDLAEDYDVQIVQAKGCAAFSEMASFSMRERHSRYEGMFTFKRSAEVAPIENMNLTLGKIGALNCVLQALVKHRANKQVVWRATWCAQWLVKSKPNKEQFLDAGGVSTVKNVMACHESDGPLLKELNNLLILLGAEKQSYYSHVFDGPVDTSKPSGCYHRGECNIL